MQWSFLLPFLPRQVETVLPFAALARLGLADRLWQGESLHLTTTQQFAAQSGAGFRVPVGVGVNLMPLRHPWEAALQARSLAATTGRPVVAGFGPGPRALQHALLGAPYRSPLGAVREYLTVVRSLLDGGAIDHQGHHVTCRAALPPLATPPVEVGAGVLRPAMAEVAGEVADVAITWMTPAEHIRRTLMPALRAGADRTHRPVPRVVAMVPVLPARRSRTAVELALASSSAHLAQPHYRSMLTAAGAHLAGKRLDRDAAQALAIGAILHGDPSSLRDDLLAYAKAGVDEVVLNLTGIAATFGPEAALDDLTRLLQVLR